jgi:hypothetical protein
MVELRGKHMSRVWQLRKQKEEMLREEKGQDATIIRTEMFITEDEEKAIRRIIKKQDTNLILEWLKLNPDVVESAKKNFPSEFDSLEILTKIRCATEVDISHRRLMIVLKTLITPKV